MMMSSILSIILLISSIAIAASAYALSDRPVLKYGTAWKKEATAELVEKAIKAGFRHIDTACQPRHYKESGVGDGWKASGIDRKDIWLQTKFSGLGAHDPESIPYDKNLPLEDRVRQSLAKSLQNLQTEYIDSWLMHGQENSWEDHWKVYRTMEEAVDQGKVKQLGISNFYRLEDVVWAYDNARIKFKVVQNRFYADAGHDVQIRAFCKEHDIEYQSFWTLTANPDAYRHPDALRLAKRKGLSPEGLFYAFCMALGISPMDGTTNEVHMREDIALMDRIRNGEQIFDSIDELSIIGDALEGEPEWYTEEEDEL